MTITLLVFSSVYDRLDDGGDQDRRAAGELQSSGVLSGERVGRGGRSAAHQLHAGRHSHHRPAARQHPAVLHLAGPRRKTVLARPGETVPLPPQYRTALSRVITIEIYWFNGQVTVIFVVCLSVCLCRVFLSRLRSDVDQTRTRVSCPGLVVSRRI